MLELRSEKFNSVNPNNYIGLLDEWQVVCLTKYDNVLISKKHFNEKIARVYKILYGENIKSEIISNRRNLDAYSECVNFFISSIEFRFNKKIILRDLPATNSYEVDCIIIEAKNNN